MTLSKRVVAVSSLVMAGLWAGRSPQAAEPIRLVAQPFPLTAVRLWTGLLPRRSGAMAKSCCNSIRTDSCTCSACRPGCLPQAEPYGGWEAPEVEVRGHSLGHYLSACALTYAATSDPRFKDARSTSSLLWPTANRRSHNKRRTRATSPRFPNRSSTASRHASRCGCPGTRCTRSWRACWRPIEYCDNQQALDVHCVWPTGSSSAWIACRSSSSRRCSTPSSAA